MNTSCCRAAVPSSVCTSKSSQTSSAATPGYIKFGAVPTPYERLEPWDGNAYAIHQCNFVASRPFYVTAIEVKVESADSFSVAIRSRVGDDVSRYLLFSTHPKEPEYLKLYNNQRIPKNFCIEIWTVDNRSIHMSHPVTIFGSLKECFFAAPTSIECFDHKEIPLDVPGDDPIFTFDPRLPHLTN